MAARLHRGVARALHLLPPETAHGVALRLLAHIPAARVPHAADSRLQCTLLGIDFATPIGLAAGFDKDARAIGAFQRLGWGFVEVGGVTPSPQQGNARPRLFRLAGRNVVNRMGFNSQGMEAVRERLVNRPSRLPVLVNLGVNQSTEDPASDWCLLLERLQGLADAFTLNLSSPNTQTLAQLRSAEALTNALKVTLACRDKLAQDSAVLPTPLLAKISPDLEEKEIEQIAEACLPLDGVIATNTSPQLRESLAPKRLPSGGGLSGPALADRALTTLRRLDTMLLGRLPLIAVGGVFTAEDAYGRIRAGASLVQMYTSIIWEGAAHGRSVAEGLIRLLERDGFSCVGEAVAADRRFGACVSRLSIPS